MVTISLCMIVKDGEAVLARCLDSVREIADEIVVVDTGSADRTRQIAAEYGRVFDFAWCDDFSAARNFSFEQAEKEYILWLDADDVIAPEDRERFLALKERMDGTEDVVMLPYHTAFDEQGRPTFTYYRERLLRRSVLHRRVKSYMRRLPSSIGKKSRKTVDETCGSMSICWKKGKYWTRVGRFTMHGS